MFPCDPAKEPFPNPRHEIILDPEKGITIGAAGCVWGLGSRPVLFAVRAPWSRRSRADGAALTGGKPAQG